jgi:hypothetical protein
MRKLRSRPTNEAEEQEDHSNKQTWRQGTELSVLPKPALLPSAMTPMIEKSIINDAGSP